MIPLDRRKIIYALLTVSFMINSGLALYDNNLTGTPGRIFRDIVGPEGNIGPFDVGLIDAGSVFTSTVAANLSLERGSDVGYYVLEATAENAIYGDAYQQHITGDYILSYISQANNPISLSGYMDRTRLISFAQSASTKVDTLVDIEGISGGSTPWSRSSVELMDHAGVWSDMAWMRLLSIAGSIPGNKSGSGTLDMSLDELGISLAEAPIQWKAIVTDQVLRIQLLSASQGLMVSATFREGVPWPESYTLLCTGSYPSEEGPVHFGLSLSYDLEGSIEGSGAPIPWERIIREPSMTPASAPIATGDTLSEGGDTSLRFNPQQALERAKEQSDGLSSFLQEEVGVSFSSMSYYNNATLVPDEVVWNITLTSSRSTRDGHPYYVFAVSAPFAGGRLDLARFELIYERSGYRFGSALRGRPIITLADHERSLKACGLSEMFLSGTGYSSSYELNVLDRSAFGTSASTTLLSNMLGSGLSNEGDLFISYAEDPRDHKTAYVAIIDGKNGCVSSLMTLTGGLSPYGAGLA